MFHIFLIKMFKMEAACGFLEGKGLERGRMGRAEVAHISPSYSQQLCFARVLLKTLELLLALWQKSPGPAPSKCEFLVESTWHVETTGWKITTVSGECHIYRSDIRSF